MKKLHIHVNVPNLAESILFYSGLFDSEPSKTKTDYAKWDLEEPRVNFAISTHSQNKGLDHLGIQVDSEAEVDEIKRRLEKASQPAGEVKSGVCCYAESTKSWSIDKAGIPWESFVTMKDAEVYGADAMTDQNASCCGQDPRVQQDNCC